MSTVVVSIPLGATGSVSVSESAGKVSIVLSEDAGALVKLLADGTSNATLKAILEAAAAAISALPA